MSQINLTEEELAKLLEAVNGEVEPPPELAGKLFPSLGKFDFETLNRICKWQPKNDPSRQPKIDPPLS